MNKSAGVAVAVAVVGVGFAAALFFAARKSKAAGKVGDAPYYINKMTNENAPAPNQGYNWGNTLDNIFGEFSIKLAGASSSISGMFGSRGVRNNNPLNLTVSGIAWAGKIPLADNSDGKFEQFSHAWYGVRAGAMDVKNSYLKDGANTVRKLVSAHSKTDLANYTAYVSRVLGVGADVPFDVVSRLAEVVQAMVYYETGSNPYPAGLISSACTAAITGSPMMPVAYESYRSGGVPENVA